MSGQAIQPMDSYRLGQYQFPVPCYLCGKDNLFDAESCRNCAGPMNLQRYAEEDNKHRPQLIVTLGANEVGKTVYLGTLLDILSRQRGELDFMTCGASSLSMSQTTVSALARCEFPPITPKEPESWNWAHCRLQRRTRKKPLDVFFVDMAGSALLEQADHPGRYPSIGGAIGKATGTILMIDADRAGKGDKDEEFFGRKILSYLADSIQHHAPPKNRKRGLRPRQEDQPMPISIVLAKADQNEACFDNLSEFVRGHLPGVWNICQERFPLHRFFACSVVAGTVMRKTAAGERHIVPLRVEPRGVIEPFRWLAGNFAD